MTTSRKDEIGNLFMEILNCQRCFIGENTLAGSRYYERPSTDLPNEPWLGPYHAPVWFVGNEPTRLGPKSQSRVHEALSKGLDTLRILYEEPIAETIFGDRSLDKIRWFGSLIGVDYLLTNAARCRRDYREGSAGQLAPIRTACAQHFLVRMIDVMKPKALVLHTVAAQQVMLDAFHPRLPLQYRAKTARSTLKRSHPHRPGGVIAVPVTQTGKISSSGFIAAFVPSVVYLSNQLRQSVADRVGNLMTQVNAGDPDSGWSWKLEFIGVDAQ